MLAIARFSVPLAEASAFAAQIEIAHSVLAERDGYISGEAGRNCDDPTLWVLMTCWKDVGSYRRALGSMDVKMQAIPLLARAIDEPGAYDSSGLK
jgi:quinol monooxygenase YgiN